MTRDSVNETRYGAFIMTEESPIQKKLRTGLHPEECTTRMVHVASHQTPPLQTTCRDTTIMRTHTPTGRAGRPHSTSSGGRLGLWTVIGVSLGSLSKLARRG